MSAPSSAMLQKSIKQTSDLQSQQNEIRDFLIKNKHNPKIFSFKTLGGFFEQMADSVDLILDNMDILIFVIIQLVVIMGSFYLFTAGLKYIPESHNRIYADLFAVIIFFWLSLIIGMASYFLSLCDAAVAALYNLRRIGQKASLYNCLSIAFKASKKIWFFMFIDAYTTVINIVSRIPHRKSFREESSTARELGYYVWKLATMTVIPSLVNGRNYSDAAKEAFMIVSKQPITAFGLRFGYSAICWIVGIAAYLISVYFMPVSIFDPSGNMALYDFLKLIFIPMFITVGIIIIFIRPLYFMGVCKLYADLFDITPEMKADLENKV